MLIDKEDAIKALAIEADKIDHFPSWVLVRLMKALEEVPSAEPEEFEWCHDCKEYDQEAHCCHRWTKVIRNTVEELKTERTVAHIGDFTQYQIDWLTAHNDLELEPELESWVIRFLKDTADCYDKEYLTSAERTDISEILQYLDEKLHPIVSPEHWNVYSELHDMIATLPAERKGKWIDRSDGGRILYPWFESYECNECGYTGSGAWHYCPNCGARMVSEDVD